jgi:hypothetical protein
MFGQGHDSNERLRGADMAERRDHRCLRAGIGFGGERLKQRDQRGGTGARIYPNQTTHDVCSERSLAGRRAAQQPPAHFEDVVRALADDAADQLPAAVLIDDSERGLDADVECPHGTPRTISATISRPHDFSLWRDLDRGRSPTA